MKPKILIIPLYLIYIGLIMYLTSMMPDKESIQGMAVFSLVMGWIPAYVGLWLHEKLCPKQYQIISPMEQYELDFQRYMESCKRFENESKEFETWV